MLDIEKGNGTMPSGLESTQVPEIQADESPERASQSKGVGWKRCCLALIAKLQGLVI